MDQETYSVGDDGASRRNVVKGMRKFGICQEELWPFKKRLLNKKPPDYVYAEAKRYTVASHQIPLDITAIKTCLANQIPAIVGIKIHNGSRNEARINGGYLSIPDPEDVEIAYTVTHAVLLVGYDDKRQHFIVRNSWGSQWVRTTNFS
jgi:C1A family cysteine protease